MFTFLVRAMVLLTAIPIHECAHAWAAARLGDPTARNLGRMTLNPIPHLDLLGSVLLLFAGFGWAKPVPISTRNFDDVRKGMALSALAGPAANLILALISMILWKLWVFLLVPALPAGAAISSAVSRMLSIMVILNINLAVFNLIPLPPLDGSRLLTALLPSRLYYRIMANERIIMMAVFVLVLTGALDVPLRFLSDGVFRFLDFVTPFPGR